MFRTGVVDDMEWLASADPAVCDRDALVGLVACSQRVRCWLDALDVRIAVRSGQLAADGSCEAASTLLAGGGRRSSRDAESAARRAAACDELPKVHDALAAGNLSAGHADAIARTAAQLSDAGRAELRDLQDPIVRSAASTSVEAFSREMTNLARILSRDDGQRLHEQNRKNRCVRRWVDRNTGMCHTHLALDAEADARVAAAFDAAVAAERAKQQDNDERTFDQLRADALVGLITHPPDSATGERPVPEVTVLVDLDTLRHGLHDHSVGETADGNPLPPASLRRLCCEAVIVPIVLDGDGVVVDQGRARRVATREQRRALRAMYRTCAVPGCGVRFEDCQIHHVQPWEHGGPTDLANLVPLCSRHHHLVHDGHWTLTLQPDRTIVLRRPDGTVHHTGSTVDRAPAGVAPDRPRDDCADDPPEPWTPAPNTEIPDHLVRAAQRLQAERMTAAEESTPVVGEDPLPSQSATDEPPVPLFDGHGECTDPGHRAVNGSSRNRPRSRAPAA